MAIYHCSLRTISRGDDHSAVAAAAYRSGSVLRDERTGQSHNYRNRKGILNAFILLPPNAPQAYQDRLTLWNAAESAEKRKNSRVAREVILALPHELSESQRLVLTKDMASFLVEKYGVAVDAAVHSPLAAHGDDPRNHHAHLLFTTRVVKQDGLNEKTRILDDKEQGPIQVELIRQVWETLANDALQQAGFEAVRIDRRTLEDQGIDRIPQEHVGKAGTHGEDPADDEDKPRKKDEDEDGETDTGKGKAGSGDKANTPSATKKDSSSSSKERVKTRAQTRLGLNEEIKRLNEQRAAFSSIPLKVQIKELDRLMDRLDGRAQRLKTLSDKTSLPERLTKAIAFLFTRAKEFFAVRMKEEAGRTFTAAEREAKAERQRARYGRTYRASIQERMTEMRENIQILETKQKQHNKYAAFVHLIERRVELIRPELKPAPLPARTEWKATTSQQTTKVKIVREAIQVREKIPVEYRPTVKQVPLVKSFKAALADNGSPVAINNSTNPTMAIVRGEDSKRPEKPFTVAATPPKDNSRSVWHKEVKLQIKSLDQVRSDRTPIPIKEPMDSPTVWKVEANERGRAILDRMQADIRERKAAESPRNKVGFSGAFNHPTRTVTDDEAIQKVRKEAKAARAKVPPDMRAEPYEFKSSESSMRKDRFSKHWQDAGRTTAEPKKAKMSSSFNASSKVEENIHKQKPPDPKSKL